MRQIVRWIALISLAGIIVLVIAVAVMIYENVRFHDTIGPKSLGDVLNEDVYFPIYTIDPDSEPYRHLIPVYYYLEGESDADHLTTYFTQIYADDNQTRVAYLRICNLCSPPLGPGGIGLALFDAIEVRWAEDFAWTCKPPEFEGEVSGEPFRSCLYWDDVQSYHYRLYTIWPEDEAKAFANTLIKVKRGLR